MKSKTIVATLAAALTAAGAAHAAGHSPEKPEKYGIATCDKFGSGVATMSQALDTRLPDAIRDAGCITKVSGVGPTVAETSAGWRIERVGEDARLARLVDGAGQIRGHVAWRGFRSSATVQSQQVAPNIVALRG